MNVLLKSTNINALLATVQLSGIGLVIFSSLALEVAIGTHLNPGEVFMAISVYYISHQIIVYISTTGANTIFAFVGVMKRVTQILLLKENQTLVGKCPSKYAISLTDITFSWREEAKKDLMNTSTTGLMRSKTLLRECLRDLTLSVIPGELVIVVGPVGCGKSSLLMGLLGEITIITGDIGINGRISYVSEEPWIVAGSIKDNILMGRTYEPDLYSAAINSCALIKDLEVFKNGDETLLGDRGFTLSGGQRSRLCLARAVYSDADIILLDDPLSAVDAEVANHLFHECIRGSLKGKTVILATHQVHFIPEADKILVLEGGDLIFFGNYNELKNRDDIRDILGDFAFRETANEKVKKKIETAPQDTNQKLSIEEEEITEGTVAIKSYIKYALFGFKSVWVLAFIFLLIIISQVSYVFVLF